ncbi:TMV resistance protein N [Linum perenne]
MTSSDPQPWKYDVFLSFRGRDTRNNFTAHLYSALNRRGIKAYRDDNELVRGDSIEPSLLDAIEGSRDESEVVAEIVDCIWSQLTHSIITKNTHLVGMDSRIQQVMKLVGDEDSNCNSVRIIGICGMGGIGKTTLARVLHDTLLQQTKYQSYQSCFISNVREQFEKHGPTHVQQHFLSEILMEKNIVPIRDPEKGRILIRKCLQHKKVLIVLDDVDEFRQLEMLSVNRGSFGPGSRVVVTSRDKELVTQAGECVVYNIEKLCDDESLKLFKLKAFNHNDPLEEGYEEMCKSVQKYCQGLPLAIEVLGCFLNGRSESEWRSQINLLNNEQYYVDDVLNVLKISFDGLSKHEQDVFLDIACFFKGKDVSDGKRILCSSGFSAEIGFKVLAEKSLLVISNGRLEMHDLLQEMGREIVRRRSPHDPGKRSRLWCPDDVFHVLETATGTEEVEAIVLDMPSKESSCCNVRAFEKMYRLRLLIVRNVGFDQGPEVLPNGLRFLDWDGFPSDSLPGLFRPSKLVELSLCNSNIEQLCRGKAKFRNLKVMNMSHSHKLIKTPDFTSMLNLERLTFEDCTSLTEIHPSLLHLEYLVHLNFIGCTSINSFPHTAPKMPSLQELLLDGTNIEKLPESIKFFTGLSKLSLKDCKSLKFIPKGITQLKSLKAFNLSGCSELANVPEKLGDLDTLEELDVSGTAISVPPVSIFSLRNLKVLSFKGCNVLILPPVFGFQFIKVMNLANCGLGEGDIPRELGKLPSLHSLDLSGNEFVSLPDITELSRLHELHLENCKMLKVLPQLPWKINYVVVNGCSSLERLPNPGKLHSNLFFLEGFECPKLQNRRDAGFTMFLRYLKGWWDTPLPRERSGIVVPGSKIPSWFNHQNEGTSVKIRIPSCYHDMDFDDDDSHDITGLAFCIALKVTDPDDHDTGTVPLHLQDSSAALDSTSTEEEMEDYVDNEQSDESHDSYDDYDEEMEDYLLDESAYSSDDDYVDNDDRDCSFSRKRKYSTYAEEQEQEQEVGEPDSPLLNGEAGDHLWYFFVPYYHFMEYLRGQRSIYIALEGCTELKVVRTGCRLVRHGDIEEVQESDDGTNGEECHRDHMEKDDYKRSSPYNITYFEDNMMLIGMYFFYGGENGTDSSSTRTSSSSDRTSLGVYIFRR